jgi:hypothetical protein
LLAGQEPHDLSLGNLDAQAGQLRSQATTVSPDGSSQRSRR